MPVVDAAGTAADTDSAVNTAGTNTGAVDRDESACEGVRPFL